MTGMLERAARAAELELQKVEMIDAAQSVIRSMQAKRIVRAVLMAIREPDDDICEAGNASEYTSIEGCDINYLNQSIEDDRPATGVVFTAMIDAILSGEQK